MSCTSSPVYYIHLALGYSAKLTSQMLFIPGTNALPRPRLQFISRRKQYNEILLVLHDQGPRENGRTRNIEEIRIKTPSNKDSMSA